MTHADCAWILLPLGAQRHRPPSLLRARPSSPLGEACKALLRWAGMATPAAPTAALAGQAGAETSCSALRVSSPLTASVPPGLGLGGSGPALVCSAPADDPRLCWALHPPPWPHFLRQCLGFPGLSSSSSRFSTPPPTLPPGGGSINYSLFPALKMKNAKDHYHSINGAITT